MLKMNEVLKASKGLYVDDSFAMLWGKQLGDWKIAELTGTLPMTFRSNGTALINYRIFGVAEGAGLQTENLVFTYLDGASIGGNGIVDRNNIYDLAVAPVTEGADYSVLRNYKYSGNCVYGFFTKQPTVGSTTYDNNRSISPSVSFSFTAPITGFVAIWSHKEINRRQTTVVKGSTAPSSYIPYGYKLPLTLTSGAESKDTDIYIGDSKLGAEEYVDYEEQKVYKRTENLAPFIDEWGNGYVSKIGDISSASEDAQERYSPHIAVEPNETYQWSYQTGSFPKSSIKSAWTGIGWYSDDGFISRAAGEVNITLKIVAPANAKYAILSFRSFGENYNTVFIKSATPPETYIPYIQPTDPLLPFPELEAYKGTNTLDSTETLGEVTIKGKIKEA